MKQTFTYPLIYKTIIIAGILLFSFAGVMSYQQNADPWVVAVFIFFVLLSLFYVPNTFSVLTADERGLRKQLPLPGSEKFVPWGRIAEIREKEFLSRFDLYDSSGNRELSFYSNIKDFFNLLELIEERMAGTLQNRVQPIFQTKKSLLLLPWSFVLIPLFMVLTFRDANLSWPVIAALAGISGLGVFFFIKRPRGVHIAEHEVVIHYPFVSKKIPNEAIDSVVLDYMPGSYGSLTTVVNVKLTSGKNITLSGFQGSNFRLFNSIKTIMKLDES